MACSKGEGEYQGGYSSLFHYSAKQNIVLKQYSILVAFLSKNIRNAVLRLSEKLKYKNFLLAPINDTYERRFNNIFFPLHFYGHVVGPTRESVRTTSKTTSTPLS